MIPSEINYIKDAFSQIIDDIAGNPDWQDAASAVASNLGTLERELEKKVEHNVTIKGWVARCKWPCPEELYFYRGEEKPHRCGSQTEVKGDFYWDFQYEIVPLDPSLYPDLKWEDEPIEVELIIRKVCESI